VGSNSCKGEWGGVPGGLVSIVMHALLTDLACDLLLRAVNAASIEIGTGIRRSNDSGRIGDVPGESALPPIPDELLHDANRREGPQHKVAALQPAARGQEPRGR